MVRELLIYFRRTPPPCNSGIIMIQEDPNIIPIIPYSHYYWVGGPPNIYLRVRGPLLAEEGRGCLHQQSLGIHVS